MDDTIPGDDSSALSRYRALLESIENERAELKQSDSRYGNIRAGLFFAALVVLALGYLGTLPSGVVILGWCLFAAFFVAVVMNEPIRDRLEQLSRNRKVANRLIARVERNWDKLTDPFGPDGHCELNLPDHQQAAADDLDLLGKASLFQLVSMASTAPGIRTLARWMTAPADQHLATHRRRAVETLAPMREERLRFYRLAGEVSESTGTPDRFAQWAAGDRWLDQRRGLLVWANVSVVIAVVLIAAVVVGAIGAGPPNLLATSLAALIGLGVLNFGFTALFLGPAHEIFSIAMSNRQSVQHYLELFDSATWLPASNTSDGDDSIASIRRLLIDSERSATKGMHALQRVAAAGSLRQGAATFLLYLPLQAFALWDLRVLDRLENWQSQYGDSVAGWFEALGSWEALLSVAAIADEYPHWVYPNWVSANESDATKKAVSSIQLGHPLLRERDRVCNDVSVGPPGTVLLVTGSNMSGKSTMLRSVGLNISLAATGGPVCAQEFSLPSVELATSIRVSDNLSAGVSFYMAELQRLKGVVEQARSLAEHNECVSLFLLDEILQGTNSRERQIAVVQVLRHLMEVGAIGAISTHDLELADEPDLVSVATTVHFRETIQPDADGNEKMTFDYKMRQGVSPTTNALRLLEMVGLGERR
ncbi:MutS family DNA mismatch repair protein [Stieleria varia]|uniref:DNA mismatch repair protein MutS n=1 Tax=Stieleria varia TaxID=2528005 RepID=A0A5C6B787_9BACT|nr:MutS family DNA mismatch repair protein [Stieleria varia]TWU07452.1 DNA mismatch repair protein MutS [Stieleria varia]